MRYVSFAGRRPLIAGLASLGILAAIAVAYFTLRTPASQASAAAAPQAALVSVAAVVQADVATWDEFSGRLEAVERVEVRSRVSGAVLKAHFTEGALVRSGDLLITIDPAPYPFRAVLERLGIAPPQCSSQ